MNRKKGRVHVLRFATKDEREINDKAQTRRALFAFRVDIYKPDALDTLLDTARM